MTQAQELAAFVEKSSFGDLTEETKRQLKIRILDSLGCAIGALGGEPIRMLRAQIDDFGGTPHCTLIGGGRTAPDRAALYNSALVRYLDFNDSYLAPRETCHPSDNLGAVLAASEYARRSGRDFMTALAVAYQVQCRLSDVAPVRDKCFDHTTQGAYAVAAGVSKALGLDAAKTANAIAISGTSSNALRVTRTGALSHWKGLAYPNTAFNCTHAAFLAMRGVTGPIEVFEGRKGFMEAISGRFEIDWNSEGLDSVTRTAVKKYNAEVHSQSAVSAIIELRRHNSLAGNEEIVKIDVETFAVAHNIIGGGNEGSKTEIHTKEEADHSLPYMLAVALLDGQLMPEQYSPDRIRRADAQKLLRKVIIRANDAFSARFPSEMPCKVTIVLGDGRRFSAEKSDYEGFITDPPTWEQAEEKFEALCSKRNSLSLLSEIEDAVERLEKIEIAELLELLTAVGKE